MSGTVTPLPTHVLLIDDHELLATVLTRALREQGILARSAVMHSVTTILASASDSPPGVAVVDLHLGHDQITAEEICPLVVIGGLREMGWRVLVLSGTPDSQREAAAIAAGAIGSLPKDTSLEHLVATLKAARVGRPVMTDAHQRKLLNRHQTDLERRRDAQRRIQRLTPRERQVLLLLTQGQRAAQIAEQLVVSMPTVRSQISSILTKLECSSQVEATAFAREWPQLLSAHQPKCPWSR